MEQRVLGPGALRRAFVLMTTAAKGIRITDQKMSEAKVRDSQRHLQDLLAAIPAAIYTTDRDGKITYFNEAAVALAGRTPVIGSDEWCVTWKLFWPDGTPLPHDECPMAISLREGKPVRGYEAIAERPDGIRIPFIPYPTPMRDADGNVIGGINMLVDVSERKQAETQQRILLDELNHRVKNNMMMLKSLLSVAARTSRSLEARDVLDEASKRVAAMAAAQRVLCDTADASNFSVQPFLGPFARLPSKCFHRMYGWFVKLTASNCRTTWRCRWPSSSTSF
ncbi:PAS domain S-box protein [Mesorhizobium sp. B2-3-13]|uniref:histidine kinase dimerization/phosphoacceptor domain -containing protein n=1 Tax=Mesorhizobium sp. B2-3-13 TaxID=2589951 RepID=UPI00112AB9E3|nr:sensor histidine kinase [Mesorhizobium sp. B2-3-13]TPL72694.1 PAS domain S-box protein [Mesorhizobium sp. B2-3-13]